MQRNSWKVVIHHTLYTPYKHINIFVSNKLKGVQHDYINTMAETDSDNVRIIANVEFLDDCTAEEEQEIINRLDDGNEYPGFVTEMDSGTLWVCIEE